MFDPLRLNHRQCCNTTGRSGQSSTRRAALGRGEDGAILVWTVMFILLIISLTGLGLDTGYVRLVAHQLQNIADVSSLAGAQRVRASITDARALARSVGLANKAAGVALDLNLNTANAADGDIVVGRFMRSTQTFTAQTNPVNAVKVTARRTSSSAGGAVSLVFGPSFGVSASQISRSAISMVQGGIGAGVIALDPAASCALDLRGTSGSLIVNDGVIVVNSSSSSAACHSGRPTLEADELLVHGGADSNFLNQVDFQGDLYTGADPVPDPLAALPAPYYNPSVNLGTVTVNGGATVNKGPGYYAGGFTVRNGTLNLSPGVYVLGGAGLTVNGGNLHALGVMFYLVGTGVANLTGNGVVTITPPDKTLYTYPGTPDITPYSDNGVSFFQSRSNSNGSRILGTTNFNIEGTLYFPAAQLEIGGTSNNIANALIANTIYAHGDGDLIINYDGRFPPLPLHVFLAK